MRSPTRRAALAVAATLLLVTAGCLGGANPTDTGSSSIPETTECTYDAATNASTATGTWSPNASVDQYPPGVADNGTLTNVSTLLDAHFDATANTSMALRFESSLNDQVRTLVHGPNRTPLYSTFAESYEGERAETAFYGAAPHGFAQVSLPNETFHVVYQNASTAGISGWTKYDGIGSPEGFLHGLVEGGDYSVNGTVERGDRTFVQLTTSEDSLETGHITNGTVLVTPEGVVHDIDATVVRNTCEDCERRLDTSVTLDTDVEWCGAPSWVADVPHLSLSIVEDGHAVEIRNTGGATLPANASFDVTGGEQPDYGTEGRPRRGDVKGTVTTDARLESGEAVYVTAGADGSPSSFALHDEPTRGEYTFGNAGLAGHHGNVSYRLATGIEPWSEAE
jgi:hypothetical protein